MIKQTKTRDFLRLASQILKTSFQHVSFRDLYADNCGKNACLLSEDGKKMTTFLRSALEDDLNLANRQQMEEQVQAFFQHLKVTPITIYDVFLCFADNVLYPRRNTYRYRYEYTDNKTADTAIARNDIRIRSQSIKEIFS